jgi:hypothetical protein
MTQPNIEFNVYLELDGIFEQPVAARNAIPEWYRKQERYMENKITYNHDMEVSHTIKRCMPVLDCMTSGYIIKLPSDLLVSGGEHKSFSWAIQDWTLIESHSESQVSQYPRDDKWSPTPYKFKNPFGIKTPEGYSCLFIDPMHSDKKPFMCMPAIVDTDDFNTPLNFPFFIEKDFEGIISAGTPIIQVIPFKREDWTSSTGHITREQNNRMKHSSRLFADRYMKSFRKPKNFK